MLLGIVSTRELGVPAAGTTPAAESATKAGRPGTTPEAESTKMGPGAVLLLTVAASARVSTAPVVTEEQRRASPQGGSSRSRRRLAGRRATRPSARMASPEKFGIQERVKRDQTDPSTAKQTSIDTPRRAADARARVARVPWQESTALRRSPQAMRSNCPRVLPPARPSPSLTRVLPQPESHVRAALARSDPPLGFVPDFTFRSPVMSGSSARWKKGGGSEGLLRIMRYVR